MPEGSDGDSSAAVTFECCQTGGNSFVIRRAITTSQAASGNRRGKCSGMKPISEPGGRLHSSLRQEPTGRQVRAGEFCSAFAEMPTYSAANARRPTLITTCCLCSTRHVQRPALPDSGVDPATLRRRGASANVDRGGARHASSARGGACARSDRGLPDSAGTSCAPFLSKKSCRGQRAVLSVAFW